MKSLFIFIIISISNICYSQTMCDCETVYADENFTGYCFEYFDLKWNWVAKQSGNFKYINYYFKGKRANRHPVSGLSKGKKLFVNNKEFIKSDSITLLNGHYQFRIKDSIVLEEYIYRNGYLVKYINRDKIFYKKKLKGGSLKELAEYDYSTIPFKEHYMLFFDDEKIKQNYIIQINENGDWYNYDTEKIISPKPQDFSGVSDTK